MSCVAHVPLAAASAGMSAIVMYPSALGTSSECPGATGKASRKANACSVSKILWHGTVADSGSRMARRREHYCSIR